MKLKYELTTGHYIESPRLEKEEANKLIEAFVGYLKDKELVDGGYLSDGVNYIDIQKIVAITMF